jgi:hypothetical protein
MTHFKQIGDVGKVLPSHDFKVWHFAHFHVRRRPRPRSG